MPTHCKAGHPSLLIFNGHLHNSGRTAQIAHRNSEPNRPNETCWVENLRLEVLNQELIRADPHLWRVIGPRRWKSTFFFSPFFILSSLAFVWGATWYVGYIFLPCLPDRLGKHSETCYRYGSRWFFTSRGNYRQIIVPPSCHQNQEKSFFFSFGEKKPLECCPRPKLSCHCFQYDFNLLSYFFCSFSRDRLCQNIKARVPAATCVPH